MNDEEFFKQLDAILAADNEGLLQMPEKSRPVTDTDRLVRAFGEVSAFYATHGREPSADTLDIAERQLGARLVGIRADAEKTTALAAHDPHGLLQVAAPQSIEEILASGDIDLLADPTGLLDVSSLPARKSPVDEGERAVRVKAKDFEVFAHLFTTMHQQLEAGTHDLCKFSGESTIREGDFYVIGGVLCFVAEVKEIAPGEKKPRLRLIFENRTESSMYRESLATRIYETGGYAIARTQVTAAEFGDVDQHTGWIYVLKSLSTHPDIRSLSDLHKIGFSRGPVEKRIAGAEKSPTYLMAPVEIVDTYKVYNLRASVLERLLHHLFAAVKLDASVATTAGGNVSATEWFLVPLPVIQQAIELVQTGEISNYEYNPALAQLIRR